MKISELLMRVNYYANKRVKETDHAVRIFKRKAYNRLYLQIRNNFLLSDDVNYFAIVDKITMTKSMADHLHEIMTMEYTPKAGNSKDQIIAELAEVNGIGEVLAEKLYVTHGVRSIADLQKNKTLFASLPIETKLFLTYTPLRLIPHDLIAIIEELLKKHGVIRSRWHIVGSYRRKKPFSRDIDIMVVMNDSNRQAGLETIVQKVNKIKNVQFHVYSQGTDKVSGILSLDHNGKELNVKLDFFACTREEYPFMLLYSTGSKEHNLYMRRIAKERGYMLNQRGLYLRGTKEHVKKFVKTEKEIFALLEIDYVSPEKRL
jgi:DNA polymerase/3'-5' exonuclease PolX